MVTRESLNIIFQEGDFCLGEAAGRTYLVDGTRSFWFSDHPYEPCLYVKSSDGAMMTTATPSNTPITETQVITLVTLRFGFRYLSARKRLNGMG